MLKPGWRNWQKKPLRHCWTSPPTAPGRGLSVGWVSSSSGMSYRAPALVSPLSLTHGLVVHWRNPLNWRCCLGLSVQDFPSQGLLRCLRGYPVLWDLWLVSTGVPWPIDLALDHLAQKGTLDWAYLRQHCKRTPPEVMLRLPAPLHPPQLYPHLPVLPGIAGLHNAPECMEDSGKCSQAVGNQLLFHMGASEHFHLLQVCLCLWISHQPWMVVLKIKIKNTNQTFHTWPSH